MDFYDFIKNIRKSLYQKYVHLNDDDEDLIINDFKLLEEKNRTLYLFLLSIVFSDYYKSCVVKNITKTKENSYAVKLHMDFCESMCDFNDMYLKVSENPEFLIEFVLASIEFFKLSYDDKLIVIQLTDHSCDVLNKICPTHALDQAFFYRNFSINNINDIYNYYGELSQNSIGKIEKTLKILLRIDKTKYYEIIGKMLQCYYFYNYYILEDDMPIEDKITTINGKILFISSFAGNAILFKEVINDYVKYLENKDVIDNFYENHKDERSKIYLKNKSN